MMEYKTIKNLKDLSHLLENESLRVINKNGYTIVDYMITDNELFKDPFGIECRGITFDENGDLIHRPLHKFFNLGEGMCPVTIDEALALDKNDFTVLEKLDGSMISIALVKDKLSIKTRASFDNEQSIDVFKYLAKNDLLEKLYNTIKQNENCTFIFEWTAPQNIVVLPYKEEKLTLLAIRINDTGEYVNLHSKNMDYSIGNRFYRDTGIDVVKSLNFDSIASVMDLMKTQQDAEGFVVQTHKGFFKVKNDWYCSLHKTLSYFRVRDIAELIIDDHIDDLKGKLTQNGIDVSDIIKIEIDINENLYDIKRLIAMYIGLYDHLINVENKSKDEAIKAIALKAQRNVPLYTGLIMRTVRGGKADIRATYKKLNLKSYSLDRLPIKRIDTDDI